MKPLNGHCVMVTRPRDQAESLATRLVELGARAIVLPAIEIAPLLDFHDFDQVLRSLDSYDWVVLTSVNGVESVCRRMEHLGIPLDRLSDRRLAVIGPATSEALKEFVRKPDLMPNEYVAEAIAEALGEVAGQRFLLARADIARKNLALALRAKEAEVDEIAAYRIVPTSDGIEIPAEAPDFITFTSSAGVLGTLENLRAAGREDWLRTAELVCIGLITAQTVRETGHVVAAIAQEYTVPGLVEALLHLASRKEPLNV